MELSHYNRELKVSRQSVGNYIKAFEAEAEPAPEKKKQVKVLYFEADEDHLKIKAKKKKAMAKLVYIHEDITGDHRKRLINPLYFTTISKSADQLWFETAEYILHRAAL